MKEDYKNLATACNIFTEEYDLSVDQNIVSLDLSINQGYINLEQLKNELSLALSDSNFEWLQFAIKTKLIMYDIHKYDDGKINKIVLNTVGVYLDTRFT